MARYVAVRSGGWRWRVAEDFATIFREGAFSSLDRLIETSRLVKDLRHKKTVEYDAGEDTFLVKFYKATTWTRKLKVYAFGCKAWHELDMSEGLLRLGVPTVPVAAVGQRGAEGCVVVEKLVGWSQLEGVLLSNSTDPRLRRALIFEYGQFARQLHDAGVWQYDFNASNILVKDWGARIEFKVIDFEKMKLFRRIPEELRHQSVAKMNRITKLSRSDRLRFLEGYLHKYPDEQRRMSEIVSDIMGFADRQESRDSVKILRSCVEENRNYGPFEFSDLRGYYRKRHSEAPGGLELEEVKQLAEASEWNGSFRIESTENALHAWKMANQLGREGGELPIAVIVRKGEQKGRLVYRAGPVSSGR